MLGFGASARTADELTNSYRDANPRSAAIYARLRRVLPGGETRAVTYFGPFPLAIVSGRGARVTDADGHVYLDVLNNYTSLVHGHAFAPISDAIASAMSGGTAHAAPSERQYELAELLCDRYPAVESLRFANSGSEAAMLAQRIARRATGRRRILLFTGAYHGTAPDFADDGPDTIRVPYNDSAAVASALDSSVAAVFAEPFLGSGGVILGEPSFLANVQALAQRNGALFALDEVQALRNAFHGMHHALDLDPDLVLMGKIIGGGLPVGAVGGREALLILTAADRPTSLQHSGTFNGNPLTMAAGLASMRGLTEGAIELLNLRAEQLREAIQAAADSAGVAIRVNRAGSILHVHIRSSEGEASADDGSQPERSALLHLALLSEGVYAAPRGMLNLSTVMSDADLELIPDAYQRAFAQVARLAANAPAADAARSLPA